VELVYIILKCITQFAYVICDNGTDEGTKLKKDKLKLVFNADGSATLTLSKVKVKNYSDWSRSKHGDFVQNNWVGKQQLRGSNHDILQFD
jgi:hypothetical protein